jgi:hypothetical protein
MRAVTDLLLRYPLAGALTDDPGIRRMTTKPYLSHLLRGD